VITHVAGLLTMPKVQIPKNQLKLFGDAWFRNGGNLSRSPPYSSINLGELIDECVGRCLATFLGNIPVVKPSRNDLIPQNPDCVEVGPSRVIGGVRPQNFDVIYRPDGVRIAFDSKTLNDLQSVQKNYQNMINDLATEATTVHLRFPLSLVAFIIAIPEPAFTPPQSLAIIETLERLTGREDTDRDNHKAEVISLLIWNPTTGIINSSNPVASSPLRIETFSTQLEGIYRRRYKGLPPHI